MTCGECYNPLKEQKRGMTTAVSSQTTSPAFIVPALLEGNTGEVGRYFQTLVNSGLRKWENWTIGMLSKSRAYADNDLHKLLEFANDMNAAHHSMVTWVDKYTGELFHPNAANMEREVTAFLETKIIPYLQELVNQ